jgi:signal transduction histidine kinase
MTESLDAAPLERHTALLRMLYEASKRFAEEVTNPERLLTTIAAACSQLVGDYASIARVRDDGAWIDLVAVFHPDPDLDRDFRTFSKTAPVRMGEGLMGGVIKNDRALLLPEVDPESIVARAPEAYREIARRLNVCSFVGVPMHARGKVIGGISMARSGKGKSYNDEDLACLQDLGDRAALALENASLYADLERRVAVATAELAAENRRVQLAAKLKSVFVTNLAHELRAPLNAILGFSDLLHDGIAGELAPVQKEYVGHIVAGGRHLLRVITDVLDLSKVEAGRLVFRPVPVDVKKLVDEVTSVLGATATARHVSLVSQIDDLGAIVVDPVRFKQVLYNFVSNAIKFSREGGSVEVRVRAEDEDQFRIEVEDAGVGIAEDALPRLFIEFEQVDADVDDKKGGTGLGLALTRQLVLAQGGTVGVRSQVGKGSVFHATLPRIRNPSPA